MAETVEYRKSKLKDFLKKWSLSKIQTLQLKEYVLGGKNTANTFSYWLEEETSSLGGIGGIGGGGAFRFGVYIQKNPNKYGRKSQFIAKGGYAWKKGLGDTPNEAFIKIRNEIISIIKNTQQKKYDKIDVAGCVFPTVRWKIAYLYSQGNLSPFFSLSLLKNVAKHLGMQVSRVTTRAELQSYITKHRFKIYPGLDVFEFSDIMWKKYSNKKKKQIPDSDPAIEGNKYPEGNEGEKVKKEMKEHLVRERDSKFRNEYRKLKRHVVDCPACSINANKKYKLKSPNRFLEMHHIEPLRHRKKASKTTIADVTLLCPNCHRAIHRMMIEDKLKTISTKDFVKRFKS